MIRHGSIGKSYPLGASVYPDGVNFSVFSRNATAMELLLFDDVDAPRPARIISLDPKTNRTFYYWYVFVPGLNSGQLYGFRAHGPFEQQKGLCFDPQEVLLDPYGRGVAVGKNYNRAAAAVPGDNAATAMKSVIVDPCTYDWEDDRPLNRPFSQTVIYEMHVAGFTQHPSSMVSPEKRGTYAGLIEKIPYLKDLGITAVELMPVYQFDEQDCPDGLSNYWGYSPISFFAPHLGLSSIKDPIGALDEFRDMVKALHRAGIEVILDVVYNHTAEGNNTGPTFCFRGLENSAYYMLENNGNYRHFSGTGNTFKTNHPIVRRLIVDSLNYWVRDVHIDGFRFDLASIMSRDEGGQPMENPPILWAIESDPVLAGTKLIAEAWDAAGLYQVGNFIGDRWKEWNGKFRDDVRSFVRGDKGTASRVVHRLFGSPDIYGHKQREPERSINFVTCHDGFTLNDLVSYNHKHNEANKENNQDGADYNLSWNCGLEGPTGDPAIEKLRKRQIKNFLAITLLAWGTPMLVMGDELRRTQRGNNNAYCQNNELSWFDWTLLEKHSDIHRFVKHLINFRLGLDNYKINHGMNLIKLLESVDIQWHGTKLGKPDWEDHSHSLAFEIKPLSRTYRMYGIINAYWEPLDFELPPVPGTKGWCRLIDTSLDPPDDFCELQAAPLLDSLTYRVGPRSGIFLVINTPNRTR